MRVCMGPLRGYRWIAGSAPHGCWLGTYERASQDVFRTYLHEGATAYDVGANAGFFTLLAAALVGPAGSVYAFEPVDTNVTLIRRHLRLNEVDNVKILPVAVSDRDGVATFAPGRSGAMGGLSPEGALTVETVTLDRLLRTGGAHPPSFIKMDIEGGEHAALLGATELLRQHHPVILLSAHGWAQYGMCGDVLRDCGYEVELLVDGRSDGNYVALAKPRSQAFAPVPTVPAP
jgi:FkbM family methyltransferase